MNPPELAPTAKAELLATLARILPEEALSHGTEDIRPSECDGLSAYRRLPLAVALPEHIDQVHAILRLCHERRVPVAARGAGTGVCPAARCRSRMACS